MDEPVQKIATPAQRLGALGLVALMLAGLAWITFMQTSHPTKYPGGLYCIDVGGKASAPVCFRKAGPISSSSAAGRAAK